MCKSLLFFSRGTKKLLNLYFFYGFSQLKITCIKVTRYGKVYLIYSWAFSNALYLNTEYRHPKGFGHTAFNVVEKFAPSKFIIGELFYKTI